jgi:hypothetical protein
MMLRRQLILMSTGLACAYTLLAPTTAPSLGTIECAAPPYFDAMNEGASATDDETGMILLRQQAGLALAQLQIKKTATQ